MAIIATALLGVAIWYSKSRKVQLLVPGAQPGPGDDMTTPSGQVIAPDAAEGDGARRRSLGAQPVVGQGRDVGSRPVGGASKP